ncbi:MFS transporter [Nocardia sp. IFM 10818]
MTSPRDPGAESGRWGDEESPLIERHPGYDRYPPANTPRRPQPPRAPEPDLPEFLARRTRPLDSARPGSEAADGQPRGRSRWSLRRHRDEAPEIRPDGPPPTRPFETQPWQPSGPQARREAQPPARRPQRDDPATRPEPPRNRSEPTRPQAHSADETAGHAATPQTEPSPGLNKPPRKLTVTRVAARRSIELTERGFATFQRAAKADGAEESGLTALVYATMANFATDAAVAVALANTLFFASATAESKSKVALYLLITIAPFAVIAPLIGPMLDRLQHGRRVALAASFAVRVFVAGLLIFNIDTWALYPLALCMMIMSKSFSVLKSAVTPRVLPPGIDLVRTNSRLTVFGLVGGTLGAGGIAGLIASVTGSMGALLFAAFLAGCGAYLSLKIPRWVEVTEGEVPATIGYHGDDGHTEVLDANQAAKVPPRKRRQPIGRSVVTGLWGNGTVRVLTGFLTFYVAFVAKATEHRPVQQAAMLGVVGAAAAIGNFTGNATGARMKLGRPTLIVLYCTIGCVAVAIVAALLNNLIGAAVATLVAAGASALAKVSLDASIQDDLPAESIASGFGRSETVLQLSWVVGGAMGVLLPTDWWKGFAIVAGVMALGLIQTVVSYRGHSLLPGLGGNRPQHAKQEVPGAHGVPDPT